MRQNRTFLRFIGLCTLVLSLSACDVAEEISHGYVPDPELVENVKPGVHSRDQVVRLLGSPSTIGTFEAQYWYYISRKIKRVAMLEPDILEQNVLVIEFDPETERVKELYRFALEDGQIIDPLTRTTPTLGAELNIFQQLLGNIGRFTPQE